MLEVHRAGAVVVDVPKEAPARISMEQLKRVANLHNEWCAGDLLARNIQLEDEARKLRERCAKLERQLQQRSSSTSMVPAEAAEAAEEAPTPLQLTYNPATEQPAVAQCARHTSATEREARPEAQCERQGWCTRGERHGGCCSSKRPRSAAMGGEDLEVSLIEKLSLRCVFSRERLHDPAKLQGCRHVSRCNYASLEEAGGVCPVHGCRARNRARLRQRDDTLRKALDAIPRSTQAEYALYDGTGLVLV